MDITILSLSIKIFEVEFSSFFFKKRNKSSSFFNVGWWGVGVGAD